MSAKFHYINHACFVVAKNDSAIIFDPYLDGNPEGLTADDIKVDYILLATLTLTILAAPLKLPKNAMLLLFPLQKSPVWQAKPAARPTACTSAVPICSPLARCA